MMKFIGSGILGAVTVAGAGYNYVHDQNALIASQKTHIERIEHRDADITAAALDVQKAGAKLDAALKE